MLSRVLYERGGFWLDYSLLCTAARSALQTTELAHVSACQALADVVRDHGDWCSGCLANLVFGRGRLSQQPWDGVEYF